MRSILRPSRQLVATLAAAVGLSACGVGVTALTGPDDVAQALRDTAATSRTVTVRTQATFDPAEVAQLGDLGEGWETPSAEELDRLQALVDRSAVQLVTADDGSRQAALLWDDQPAVDVRVLVEDEVDPTAPFPATASARLDVGVLLQMVLTAQPDLSPAELLDLRNRLSEVGEGGGAGAVDPDGVDADGVERPGLPEEAAAVARTLLAGQWVSVTGMLDPAQTDDGHDLSPADRQDVMDVLTGAWTLSDPSPADGTGQTATATLDLAALTGGLRDLVAGESPLPLVEVVLTDLIRYRFDADGLLSEARTDVLDAWTRLAAQPLEGPRDGKAEQARAAAGIVDGWQTTSVEVVATVTDAGAVPTVAAEVDPALTLTWDEAFALVADLHAMAGGTSAD